MKNPAEVARKWSQRLAASTESIRQGVQAVTVNPAAKAAAREQAYVDGVQRAVTSGAYKRGLGRVTLQSWQESMLQKGLPRVAAGASAAVPKMEAFMGRFLPYVDGLKNQLQGMPRGDLSQNIARAVKAMEYLSQFKNTGQ